MSRASRGPAWEWVLDRAVLALGRTPWGRTGFGSPHGLMRVFLLVERLLLRRHRIMPVRQNGALRYEVAPYPGRPFALGNGTEVQRGETAILLHWDNHALAALQANADGVHALTWQLAKLAIVDLQCLADMIRDGAIPAGVRAIWTETVHYQMLPRYGFTIRPAARDLRTPWARLFMLCMLAIYSRPGQLDDARVLRRLQLGDAWIGVSDLLARYPVGAAAGAE
jgi:hypothetical protein